MNAVVSVTHSTIVHSEANEPVCKRVLQTELSFPNPASFSKPFASLPTIIPNAPLVACRKFILIFTLIFLSFRTRDVNTATRRNLIKPLDLALSLLSSTTTSPPARPRPQEQASAHTGSASKVRNHPANANGRKTLGAALPLLSLSPEDRPALHPAHF